MQFTFIFTLIYIWALACLKLSQLALYLRVFHENLRISVYVVGTIVILWAIIFNFVFIFLCDPISQQWTINRIGHCMDQILLLKCLIMTNLVTDLMIVALPVRCVWRLQMRKTEKFAVLACFGLGLGCCIISIARFVLIYTIGTSCALHSFYRPATNHFGKISSAISQARHSPHSCSAPLSSCLLVSASTSPCYAPSTSNGATNTRTRLSTAATDKAEISCRQVDSQSQMATGPECTHSGWNWLVES